MAHAPKSPRQVEALTHEGATRVNDPTAEGQPLMANEDKAPVRLVYERRNRDPQLVWRGKDEQDEANLIVLAAPLCIQEKVHPKVLIDNLLREAKRAATKPRTKHRICSPISTACRKARNGQNTINMTPNGRTA